jgi:hypothetical protein
MVLRIVAGVLALGGIVAMVDAMQKGEWRLGMIMGSGAIVAFTLYAIGGQPLLERILPGFKAKPKPDAPKDEQKPPQP